jgi:uncharacterized membrane protein required for colicin V production
MFSFFHGCSLLDYLIIGVALFLVINGFRRGCSGEIGHLIGIASAAAVLLLGRGPVAGVVGSWAVIGKSEFATQLITLILMAALSVSVWLLVGHFLSKLIKLAFSQPLDAILGGLIGVVKAIIFVVMLCTFGIMGPRTDGNKAEPSALSKTSAVIDKLTPWVNAAESGKAQPKAGK